MLTEKGEKEKGHGVILHDDGERREHENGAGLANPNVGREAEKAAADRNHEGEDLQAGNTGNAGAFELVGLRNQLSLVHW